jgi:hypothetical protein
MKSVGTAGFGIRTLAYLIDAFLLGFVGGAFPYLVISTKSPTQQRTKDTSSA